MRNRSIEEEATAGVQRRWLYTGAVVLALVAFGCGDDDDGQSAQEKYCEAGQSLESSVNALTDLDLVAEGTDSLESAIDTIADEVDALQDAAADAAEDEVDALEDALDELDDAFSDLGDDISTDNVGALQTAIQGVSTAAQGVYGTLTDCP
ncbi:MAG: hypothetical protein ACR2N9_09625 [Acidimicrobiia bacterium]